MSFYIGDEVYIALFNARQEIMVNCPDCGGTKKIHVTLWNGEEFDIPCDGCARGYEEPRGYIFDYKAHPYVEKRTITGVTHEHDGVKFHFNNRYMNSDCIFSSKEDADCIFSSKEDAQKKSEELAEEFIQKEKDQVKNKEYQHRSWAWHVHYYRKEIKECQRRIDRAQENLNYAKTKNKESE